MPRSDRPSMKVIPPVPCSASSSRTGAPCKNYAIVGGKVCHFHGGAAPQVKAAAARRVAAMADDAYKVVLQIAGIKYQDPESGEWVEGLVTEKIEVRLRAAQDILDRAGWKPSDKIEITENHVTNEALDAQIAKALQSRLDGEA